jgi:hypothetical protein
MKQPLPAKVAFTSPAAEFAPSVDFACGLKTRSLLLLLLLLFKKCSEKFRAFIVEENFHVTVETITRNFNFF